MHGIVPGNNAPAGKSIGNRQGMLEVIIEECSKKLR